MKLELADEDKVRSDPLPIGRGERIINWVRNNQFERQAHVLWILLFRYGFRVSVVHALNREELILTEPDDWPDEHGFSPHLRLKNRPELGPDDDEGLPLKNKCEELAGRHVPSQPEDTEVFRHYVENGSLTGAKDSWKKHEESGEYGLNGLLTGGQNVRLTRRTIRERAHWLTCPTMFTDRECQCNGCREHRAEHERNPYPPKVYKRCNETRSPHQVRHGAITSLLDEYGHLIVARIVGTLPDKLRDVYDRADEYWRMDRVAGDWLSG